MRRAFFALWACDKLTPWSTWPVWLLLFSWLRIPGSFCGTARSGPCLAWRALGGTWCTGRALWSAVVFPAVCGSSLPPPVPGLWAKWWGLLEVATPPALASLQGCNDNSLVMLSNSRTYQEVGNSEGPGGAPLGLPYSARMPPTPRLTTP